MVNTTHPTSPTLKATFILDQETLLADIKAAVASDPSLEKLFEPEQQAANCLWTLDQEGILQFNGKIFVSNISDLRLRVLKSKHNHILSGHPGREKILQLVLYYYAGQ